jgi:hypothetical protein
MSFEHLTEEQLQELANAREIPEHAATHLQVCAACSEQLETYRLLFNEIATQPVAAFGFNVTETVMQKLSQPEAKKTRSDISLFMFFIGAGMCIAIGSLFKDQFLLLFKNISWLIPAFIVVSLGTAALALGYDMFRRYNKKINFINSLK